VRCDSVTSHVNVTGRDVTHNRRCVTPSRSSRAIHVTRLLAPTTASAIDHRASERCPCRPIPAYDLEEPSRRVYVHVNRAHQPEAPE
jgi:hypothetical protein